jgi:hypothetical protein
MDRTKPGLQETSAEREDKLGLPEVIAQGSRYLLHELMSECGPFRGKATEPDVIGSPIGLGESFPQGISIAAVLPSQDRDRVREPLGPEVRQTGSHHRNGLPPPDRSEAPVLSSTHHGSLETVGIIEEMKSSKGLGAECSPIDGMKGVPQEAAPSRALLADGRVYDFLRHGPPFQILRCMANLG